MWEKEGHRENDIFIIDKSKSTQTGVAPRTHRWTQCGWRMEDDTERSQKPENVKSKSLRFILFNTVFLYTQ